MDILFVCSGNTCRSPMAEGIMKKIVKDKLLDISVSSAGVVARNGDKASKNAIKVCKNYEIDISKHRSRFITSQIFMKADLILCMTSLHKYYLKENFDADHYKISTLIEYCNSESPNTDILDPYGGDIKIYQDCFDQLYDLINNRLIIKLIQY